MDARRGVDTCECLLVKGKSGEREGERTAQQKNIMPKATKMNGRFTYPRLFNTHRNTYSIGGVTSSSVFATNLDDRRPPLLPWYCESP